MKNFKNYINESRDLDKELQQIYDSDFGYVDRYALVFLSENNMFQSHKSKVDEIIKRLNKFDIQDFLYGSTKKKLKDKDLFYILKNVDQKIFDSISLGYNVFKDKTTEYLQKLYDINPVIILDTTTIINVNNYFDLQNLLQKVEVYRKLGKTNELLKLKDLRWSALVLKVYDAANEKIFDEIMKYIKTPKQAGTFLTAYSSIMKKHEDDDDLLKNLEKYPIFKKVSGAVKTGILKKLGDTYKSYFFSENMMTPIQYVNSLPVYHRDANVVDDLLEILTKRGNKLGDDLTKLFSNKKMEVSENEKITYSLIDDGLITKEIASSLLYMMLSYKMNYAFYGFNKYISPLFQKLIGLGGDLVTPLIQTYSRLADSYQKRVTTNMTNTNVKLLYTDLIGMIEIDETEKENVFMTLFDNDINQSFFDKLKEKYPEQHRKFRQRQRAKSFNL